MHKLSILMKEVGCIPRKRDIVRKGPLYHTSLFNGDYVAVQSDVEGLCVSFAASEGSSDPVVAVEVS